MIRFLADIPPYDDELKRLNEVDSIDLMDYVNSIISRLFNIEFGDNVGDYLRLIVIIAVIALLTWIIYKEFILPESKRKKNIDDDEFYSREGEMGTAADADIRGHNFSLELQQALSSGNFALAVNLRYLMALKQLDVFEAIRWQEWKTPMMYVEEIKNGGEELRQLTMSFLYIKYGHYPANQEVYDECVNTYNVLMIKGKGGAE